jgi:hypothetical protein
MENQTMKPGVLPSVGDNYEYIEKKICLVLSKSSDLLFGFVVNLITWLNNATPVFKLIFGIISNITLFLISEGSLEGSFIGGDVYSQFLILLIPELLIFVESVSYEENSYITAILNGFCYAIPFSIFMIFFACFIYIVFILCISIIPILGGLLLYLAINFGIGTIHMGYLLIKTKASKLNKFLYVFHTMSLSLVCTLVPLIFGLLCLVFGFLIVWLFSPSHAIIVVFFGGSGESVVNAMFHFIIESIESVVNAIFHFIR